jgi:hypothetical protein
MRSVAKERPRWTRRFDLRARRKTIAPAHADTETLRFDSTRVKQDLAICGRHGEGLRCLSSAAFFRRRLTVPRSSVEETLSIARAEAPMNDFGDRRWK